MKLPEEMLTTGLGIVIAGVSLAVLTSFFHISGVAAQEALAVHSFPAVVTTDLTWSRDIGPILYKNCVSCHHPGGAGPFSLLTYADAKRWGAQAVRVTQSRYMPPWLPEPGFGDFADNRRLPEADLAALRKWLHAGPPACTLHTLFRVESRRQASTYNP